MKYLISLLTVLSVLVLPAAASASVGITLDGGSVVINAGQSYNEPGYSAFSSFDGIITNLVQVSGIGTLPGTYTIGYNVTDSNLDSATASRSLTVRAVGNGQIWCSGPSAPGWNVTYPDGGCGGTSRWVSYNQPINMVGVFGGIDTSLCEYRQGCMVPLGR